MTGYKAGSVAAAGETNLSDRQERLRQRAEQIARELAARPEVQLIWLTGSVAKGLVDAASDIDLHVFTAGNAQDFTPWRFAADSAPENIHQFPIEDLREGVAKIGEPVALGQWMAKTCLADALCGAVCLYRRPDATVTEDDVAALVAARQAAPYRREVARTFAKYCNGIAGKAAAALEARAPLDAHQKLRRASQELLLAYLISRGWIVRGSKKRPEIATAFGLDTSELKLMKLFYTINGLDGLALDGALKLCLQRQAYRARFAEYLRAIMVREGEFSVAAATAVADYEAHNLGGVNYYAPLLDAGMVMGPVNHIRSFSGFVNLPRTALMATGRQSPFPATAWTTAATARDAEVVDGWLHISDLSSSGDTVAGMISAIEQQATAFGAE
jgi:hypothetical protein